MSKLSKAQQEVVDKMREGYIVTEGHTYFHWHIRRYTYPLSDAVALTNRNTVLALLNKGVVEKVDDRTTYYRLTEQYQTKPE